MTLLAVLVLLTGIPRPVFSGPLEMDIERALELAIENNSNIKIAESGVAAANEARRQAHRTDGVTVRITHSSSYTDYQNGEIYPQAWGKSFSNAVTASYPLYTGNVIGSSIKKAESDYKSQNEVLRKTHQDVKLNVASGVYTILRAEDAARQAEESVKRLAAHVEQVNIQYENGRVGKADLLRSEVELSSAKQSFIRASSDYDTAVKQLNSLIGLPLGTALRINETMAYEKYAPALDECIAFAKRTHPDLAKASHAIKSAEADVRIAKGERLPQASLSATQNLNSAKDWPGAKEDTFTMGINVQYTIMDAGAGAAKVSLAKENLQRAELLYEQTLETIILAVNSDYNSIMEALQRVEESASATGKAEEAYDIAVNRYNEGVGTNLDVVDFQNALTQARSNYTQALCDYNIAVVRIENSMGGRIQ
jgi:outer membrane protein TolC